MNKQYKISKLVVSGATSMLGKNLIKSSEEHGIAIEALQGDGSKSWRLGDPITNLTGESVLVHLSHDRAMGIESTNATHSKLIREFNGKVIYLSSLSAFPGCLSKYGQQKLLIEKIVLDSGGSVIKSGVMVGGALNSFTERLIPRNIGKIKVQVSLNRNMNVFWLSEYECLTNAIFNLASNMAEGTFGVYQPLPVSFQCLIKELAKDQNIKFIPIPDVFSTSAIKALSKFESFQFLDSYLSLKRECPPHLVSNWLQKSAQRGLLDKSSQKYIKRD